MKPVDRSEILPLGDYEAIRPQFRNRIIAEKRYRRVAVGPHISVTFENHDTALLQIQEMLRTERITKGAAIDHEIATYNELVPGDDQLSMTLFIEIPDKPERERILTALAGMEEHVVLEIDGQRCPASAADRDGASPDRTTAVQYYLIDLPTAQASAVRSQAVTEVALSIEHPHYRERAQLSAATVAQLAGDLSWS